jgi:hypothetical protein
VNDDIEQLRESIKRFGSGFDERALDRLETKLVGHAQCERNMDAEVERLRAQIEQAVNLDRIKTAENKRLREALRDIDYFRTRKNPDLTVDDLRAIARNALAEEKE